MGFLKMGLQEKDFLRACWYCHFPTFRDRSADYSEIFGPGVRVLNLGAAELRPG